MIDSFRRILIVDDEPDYTLMTAMTLNAVGPYVTREVNVARKVLQAALDFRPDLILLDVMMPEMDGGDVAAQLLDNPATSHIPVVFMTALVAGNEAPTGSMSAGKHTFLPKSASIDTLAACIEKTLAHTAAEHG